MIKTDKKALQKFNQIPDDMKTKILSNVYCTKCKGIVTIIDFTVSLDKNDLVLKGKCENCSNIVSRLIDKK